MDETKAPRRVSSVIAGRCVTSGFNSDPRKANVGSVSARSVWMANLNTEPMVPRNLLAVSRRPLFSTFFRRMRSSCGVIAVIGRSVSGAARSWRSHLFFDKVDSEFPSSFSFAK